MRPKCFITRVIPEAGMELIRKHLDADVWEGELPPPRDVFFERVRGVQGILCLLSDRIDKEVMDAAGDSLKVISVMAVGYDNVDVQEATRRGILVTNTPGALTETTADLTFALILAIARRVVEAVQFVKQGKWKTWSPTLLLGEDVYGKTIGIIGFGRIGQAVARRAKGFAMEVLYYDYKGREFDGGKRCKTLDELLSHADFVTLHIPSTPENKKIVDKRFFEKMKPTAFFINVARGDLVDTGALVDALRQKRIKGAALDCTDPEPLPPDHPLLSLDNCIVLPHIGSASEKTRNEIARLAAINLIKALASEMPPHPVNPEVLGR
mgnify:CR=1 FL=1